MRKYRLAIFVVGTFIFFHTFCYAAESMYVTDRLEVVVRGGRGIEYRILAVVKTDEKVEVLEYQGDYAFIRTAKGVEGWMLKRYLTLDTPKSRVIEDYKKQIELLKVDGSDAEKKMLALSEKVRSLEKTKALQAKKIKQLEKDYLDLKTVSAGVLKLKEEKEELAKRIQRNSRKLSSTINENLELKKQTKLKWFIAGGSAILLGFIIGMYLQHLRNEKKRHLSF